MSYEAFDLSGKVALVTGGNGGIGLGMAEAIAKAGANVAIWGTNEDKNAAAGEKRDCSPTASKQKHSYATSPIAPPSMPRWKRPSSVLAVSTAASPMPALPAAVPKSFLDITPDEWRRVLSVNLDGTFNTYQAAVRHMMERAPKQAIPAGVLSPFPASLPFRARPAISTTPPARARSTR